MYAVTVFCSSSRSVPEAYLRAAAEFGRRIAKCGWTLVYGGNSIGCMAALADAARAAGGRVVGITPRFLVDKGIADHRCDELVVTEDMWQRKALLEQRGDALVALPGGLGTLEELSEVLARRSLGYHDKPIVLLSIADYYSPLMEMLRRGSESGFIRDKLTRLLHVSRSIDDAVAYLTNCALPGTQASRGEACQAALE